MRYGGDGLAHPVGTLGWQGRNFIGQRTVNTDIAKFTGQPAMEPIGSYAGPGVSQRRAGPGAGPSRTSSARAVSAARTCSCDDDRQWLAFDPATGRQLRVTSPAATLRPVAIQYSDLRPDFIHGGQGKAQEAGRALVDAVYGDWAQAADGEPPHDCDGPGKKAWARSAVRQPSPSRTDAQPHSGIRFAGRPT